MSEQGWREFLAADGVEDWVVLHGGATAVYDAGSPSGAVALAGDLLGIDGFEDSDGVLTITGRHLTVRLTRDLWDLEAQHIELARAISAVAGRHDAVPDRGRVQEVQLAVSAQPDSVDVWFWRAALGYDAAAEDNAVDPLGHGSTVWMQGLDPAKPLRHAMHVDVSVAREHVRARVDAAVAAGGRVVDDSSAPAHWVLADRAGNKVCICAWPDGSDQPGLADHS